MQIGVYYADCTNTTGPGIVDYLFNNDVKFLFLDEVEKMSKADQNVLLNVMEAGMQIDITNAIYWVIRLECQPLPEVQVHGVG